MLFYRSLWTEDRPNILSPKTNSKGKGTMWKGLYPDCGWIKPGDQCLYPLQFLFELLQLLWNPPPGCLQDPQLPLWYWLDMKRAKSKV